MPKWTIGFAMGVAVIGTGAATAYVRVHRAKTHIQSLKAASETDVQSIESNGEGLVQQVLVRPGQPVKQGQLVAILSNPALVAHYQQAQKDLLTATKVDNATQAAILPPAMTGSFDMGPPPDLTRLKALPAVGDFTPPSPRKSTRKPTDQKTEIPNPQLDGLKSGLSQDQAGLDKANDDLRTSQSELEEAQGVLQASLLPVDSLKSALEIAKAKRDKFQGLYNDGIISKLEFQQKQNDLDNAQASLDQANQNVAAAQDNVKAKQTATDTLSKDIGDRKAKVAKDQATISKVPTTEAVTQVAPPEKTVVDPPIRMRKIAPLPLPGFTARRRGRFSMPHFGPPPGAFAPARVEFSPDKHLLAETKVEKAQRIVKELEVKVRALRIVSNGEGIVVDVKVKPNQTLTGKTLFLTLMKPNTERVVANFAHLDAQRIAWGQPCQVEFPLYPGRVFAGKVSRVLSVGNTTEPGKVEILFPDDPDRSNTLSGLPPGTPSTVRLDLHPKS